ncbi:MAG TPA: hypothetical protein VLS27_12245, partial [Gammaproteobacteria bacterium]|nr:hypothetical protein [Gammaproteobacteria bacterium]
LAALLSACASTRFNPAPGAPGYPAHRGEVKVLQEFPRAGSYESVGIVIAYGVDLTDREDLIEALQSEAARRGANAIVLQGEVKMRSRGTSREKVLGAYALRLEP